MTPYRIKNNNNFGDLYLVGYSKLNRLCCNLIFK